jgi:hypothetical protein
VQSLVDNDEFDATFGKYIDPSLPTPRATTPRG